MTYKSTVKEKSIWDERVKTTELFITRKGENAARSWTVKPLIEGKVRRWKNTIVRQTDFPTLAEFSRKYFGIELSWHNLLFFDILENRVVQRQDGKLDLNLEFTGNKMYTAWNKKRGWKKYASNKVNKNILLMAPRFHGKSFIFSIIYPLWLIYRNPNIRILIVSANEDIAAGFSRAILWQLENNHQLIQDFGSLKPTLADKRKWGEKAVIVERYTNEKDPTVTAVGVGGKIISRRADIIIADDIIDLETARTKRMRDKTFEWYMNVLYPVLEKEGRMVTVGTAWYKDDIYDRLWQESIFDIRLKLKALMYLDAFRFEKTVKGKRVVQYYYLPYYPNKHPMALRAEDVFSKDVIRYYNLNSHLQGGVLWEKKWDYKSLMKQKSIIGSAAFSRQYLNEPTHEGAQFFKTKYVDKAVERGKQKKMVRGYDNSRPLPGWGPLIITAGVDLAISRKKTSDYSAIAVWGLNRNRERILLWADYGRWSPEETKQKVLDVYYNFDPVKIRVENVGFQELIRKELAEEIPIEGFSTHGSNKFDDVVGLSHLSILLEQEKVIIPSASSDAHTLRVMRQLYSELVSYTEDSHSGDLLMASWFALIALRDFDVKMKDNMGFFPTPQLIEQQKHTVAPSRIILRSPQHHWYVRSYNSVTYMYGNIPMPREQKPFCAPDDKFYIFATKEDRAIAYLIDINSRQVRGKIDGDIQPSLFARLLVKLAQFHNNCQIMVDLNNEGQAVLLALQKDGYPNVFGMVPDEEGNPVYRAGLKVNRTTMALAIDHFHHLINKNDIWVRDDMVIREMAGITGVEDGELKATHGNPQRVKTLALALYLIDNFETRHENVKMHEKSIKSKILNLGYKVIPKWRGTIYQKRRT